MNQAILILVFGLLVWVVWIKARNKNSSIGIYVYINSYDVYLDGYTVRPITLGGQQWHLSYYECNVFRLIYVAEKCCIWVDKIYHNYNVHHPWCDKQGNVHAWNNMHMTYDILDDMIYWLLTLLMWGLNLESNRRVTLIEIIHTNERCPSLHIIFKVICNSMFHLWNASCFAASRRCCIRLGRRCASLPVRSS